MLGVHVVRVEGALVQRSRLIGRRLLRLAGHFPGELLDLSKIHRCWVFKFVSKCSIFSQIFLLFQPVFTSYL